MSDTTKISSDFFKVYDPQKGRYVNISVDSKDSSMGSLFLDSNKKELELDYDYLNPNYKEATTEQKQKIGSIFHKISNLKKEKEGDIELFDNLSSEDIKLALSDKSKFTQKEEIYLSSMKGKGIRLVDNETGESVVIPKYLCDESQVKKFNPGDDLDMCKLVNYTIEGNPEDTEEIKKIKAKYNIKSIEIDSTNSTVNISYNDAKMADSKLPLSIKDRYISKKEFDEKMYLYVDPKIKSELWNQMHLENDDGYVRTSTCCDVMGGVSDDTNKYIARIQKQIPDATPEQIAKLMILANKQEQGTSYYKKDLKSPTEEVIKNARMDDYTALTKNVPQSVKAKGPEAINEYRNSVLSILETNGEYGAMYIKHIPDPENIALHASHLKRLSDAAEEVQGCRFTNAAVFNGFTAEELEQKVVIPNEKLAKGEKTGSEGETLVVIVGQGGTDYNGAFRPYFESDYMKSKGYSAAGKNLKFDQAFIDHYDSILVIQPNDNQSADETLNKGFSSIRKGLDKNAKVDMTFIAHSGGGQPFLSLPTDKYSGSVYQDNLHYGERLHSTMMDSSDFGQGGQTYSKDMEKIFEESIKNGHDPRFIGQGCTSEFLQHTFKTNMSEDVAKQIKLFGNMGSSYGKPGIGYVKDNNGDLRLQFSTNQSVETEEGSIEISATQMELSAEDTTSAIANGTPYILNYSGFYEGGAISTDIKKDSRKGIRSGTLVKNVDSEEYKKHKKVAQGGIAFRYSVQ